MDNVQHPQHYCGGGIECKDAIKASMTHEEYLGYLVGNIQKYIWRHRKKNGVEDLFKAQQYLYWLIEEEQKEGDKEMKREKLTEETANEIANSLYDEDETVGLIYDGDELKKIAIDLNTLAMVEKVANEKKISVVDLLKVGCKVAKQKAESCSEETSEEYGEETDEETDEEYDDVSPFAMLDAVLTILTRDIGVVRKIIATDDISDMFEIVMGEELVTVNDDMLEAASNALRSFSRGCRKVMKLEEEYGQGSTDEEDT